MRNLKGGLFLPPLLAYLILWANVPSSNAQTTSLADYPAFESLRPCARNCFFYGLYDRVANAIGCETRPESQIECLCRSDLQDDASTFIKNCVNKSCENQNDMKSAANFYKSYCSSNGYGSETATGASSFSTNSATNAITAITSPTSTTTPTATINDPIDGSDDGNSGLDAGEIAGIVVGVLSFITTVVGAWIGYKIYDRRKAGSSPQTIVQQPEAIS